MFLGSRRVSSALAPGRPSKRWTPARPKPFPAGVSIRCTSLARSARSLSFQVIYLSLFPFFQMFKSVLPTATRALRTSNLTATRSFHTTLSRMGVTVDVSSPSAPKALALFSASSQEENEEWRAATPLRFS